MRHYNDKDLREVETQVQGLAEHDGGPRFYFKEDASADVDMSPAHAASPKMRKFEQKDVIGGGAYGMVLKCWDDVHRHEVAIKKIDWSTIEREIRRVIREVRILRHLQHPNLIRLVGLYAQETTVGKDSQDNQSSSNSYARP
ncbi:Mitogen-activated protein kinase sma-5 [Diplonema papillatum]|nr:Mitogen-activated protein kinase sma-5 [Diplonema papillatum]